ncbi:hypothetical protein [Actinotalea caeni]
MIFVALVAAAISLVWAVIAWFASADSEVARAAIAAATSVIVAAGTVTITKVLDARREIRSELRARYQDPYDKFTQMLFGMLLRTKLGESTTGGPRPKTGQRAPTTALSTEDLASMNEVGRAIILQGSSESIRRWGEWRSRDWDAIADPKARAAEQMRGMIDLMLQMRRDLGHKVGPDEAANVGAVFLQRDAMQLIGLLPADSAPAP